MEENLKVDKDYLEGFNLGYELAKELKLKSPMFKELNSSNKHMTAMQDGMEEYSKGIQQTTLKDLEKTRDVDSKEGKEMNRGKGFDLSI